MRNLKNITFWGVNIPKEIKDILNKFEDQIKADMPEDAKEGYDLGVKNTLSILQQYLDDTVSYDSITFYRPDVEIGEEMDEEDVADWLYGLES